MRSSTSSLLQSWTLALKKLDRPRVLNAAWQPVVWAICGSTDTGRDLGTPGGRRVGTRGLRPKSWASRLRRYRCLDCRHVMTVRPRLLARYFRYTTAAATLALWLWAVAGRSASAVRHEVSPWPVRGSSEAHRWRSLGRWLGRLDDLLGLPKDLGERGRALARRAAELMTARAPPELAARVRAFVGAQLR